MQMHWKWELESQFNCRTLVYIRWCVQLEYCLEEETERRTWNRSRRVVNHPSNLTHSLSRPLSLSRCQSVKWHWQLSIDKWTQRLFPQRELLLGQSRRLLRSGNTKDFRLGLGLEIESSKQICTGDYNSNDWSLLMPFCVICSLSFSLTGPCTVIPLH